MTAPLFVTAERPQNTLPLLVVDKQGILSKGLVSVLSEHFTTVLVSQRMTLPHLSRIIHVPFRRNIPAIPDNYFSSILVFYNGEQAIAQAMHSFIKKAKQNNAKLLLITSREHARDPFLTKAMAAYEYFHLVIYGDIFGISRSEDSLVTQMMHEAFLKKTITIQGSGLVETYPIYYADALQGLLHMLLSNQTPPVGLLFPSHAVTEMHLARLIKGMFPDAELAFTEDYKPRPKVSLDMEGVYLAEEPYPLAEKLKHISVSSLSPAKLKLLQKKAKKSAVDERVMRFILLTFGIFLLLSFTTFVFFFLGLVNIQRSINAGKAGDLSQAAKRSAEAVSFFTNAENTSGFITIPGRLVGLSGPADYYQQTLKTGKTVSGIAGNLADAGIAYGQVSKGEGNAKETMVRVASDIKLALLGVSQLQTDNSLPRKYSRQLELYKKPLERLGGLVDVLPQLTGVGREQTYLVLFQNNMELRPGGGFIGSYGLLTLKDGRMENFTIHDVYAADGQLTGHVEPPFALRRYLGPQHLFLRDSNFGVEFADNAALAANLLKASTGEEVDGVITVDVSFLRTMLEKLGPVYVPAYDETVSAKNFYLQIQSHAENNFFPGSSQKKDYLQHVAQAILLSLKDREQLPYLALFQAIEQAVSQKHMMVTSVSPDLKVLFAKTGFTPSVTKSPAEHEATVSDFFGLFDANLGANKSNYYIKRAIAQEISLDKNGERRGMVQLTYRNTSKKDSPFGGDYKNYLQIVLPEDTEVTGVSLNGVQQNLIPPVNSPRVFSAEQFVPPVGLELSNEIRYGRRIFGFYITVPIGQEMRVTLTYQTGTPRKLSGDFTYLLRVYKQPGTEYDPYQLKFTYDPSFRLIEQPPFASKGNHSLRVTNDLTQDIILPLTFRQE